LLLLFFSVGELFRFFLAALAVGGLYALVRGRVQLRDRWLLLFSAAFACFWLPMAISVVDAESPRVAATATARYLIYLLAGFLWIGAFVRHGTTRALLGGAFAILSFWTADALVQLVTGSNLFGEEAYAGQRLSGMMGPRLTVVLAIMSPVFFHALLRFGSPRRPLWLLVLPYLLVILYGGSRIAWMLLVIAVCLYAALLWAMGARPRLRRAAAVLAVAVALTVLAVAQTDWLQQRVVQLSGLFSDDYALVNTAVNNRLPHWEAAARMYQENPINGIGVKTYKFSYADYADGDTVFRGQPHLFVLEVAAETGTVGLLGFALFLALIAALLLRLVRQRHYDAVPWGIALLLAAFPLNATLSLYAHFMSALIWYLAIVFFAVAARETQAS
jgi:O-antigen ligase